MKHILSVTVNNTAGVLSHVSGLFTRRGYNIDSLSVGETDEKSKSVITLVVHEDDRMVEQITKQLYKLVDVIDIEDLTYKESLRRELAIMTVRLDKERRSDLVGLVEVFKASIVDMTETEVMIEMVGLPRRVSAFISTMAEFGIVNLARTGTIALPFASLNESGKGDARKNAS